MDLKGATDAVVRIRIEMTQVAFDEEGDIAGGRYKRRQEAWATALSPAPQWGW